ncbi:MAG: PIN domain nuclease [Gemmataceae bacterium]|nr:PIN domain nuclease [Gemmataceae bacterium]
MNILLDANILLRLADPSSKSHATAIAAVATLGAQGDILHIVPQCVYEFWAVGTRPIANNGLGLSISECVRETANLEGAFPLLDDKAALFTEWKTLVAVFACHGKIAHDARYVAAMRTHGLTHLLTFNVNDFTRFPGLTVLDPNVIGAFSLPSKTP